MSKVSLIYPDRNICIMGLGYVGLTLATVMAECGFQVLGVEIRKDIVASLQKGEAHFYEPGLSARLKNVLKTGRLQVTASIADSFAGSVFIITVGTPLDEKGKVRLDMVENVCREVALHLKDNDLVIMRSTVKLETTRKIVRAILEEAGVNFDLAFCPERSLEGKALQELRSLPQIVGGLTPGAAIRAAHLFLFITPTVIKVSDMETAEMIKLIDNAQRDVFFAYANEVARLCDAIGVSAAEVIQAGNLAYPRSRLPQPGPVGGPCLEKDPHILAEKILELGLRPEITLAARKINEEQPEEVISYLHSVCSSLDSFPTCPQISLLGLAFKGQPPTDDLRGTMARPVFNSLQKHFPCAHFRGFDPVVRAKEIEAFGLIPCISLEDAMKGANLILILNNHSLFAHMQIENLSELLARPALIYDFWNNFVAQELHLLPGIGYMALGSHNRAVLP